MTAPSDGTSRPARILSTVVLPQPEWPMMQTNSPRAIDSHRSSNTVVRTPPGVGKHLLTPSMEMNLSVMRYVISGTAADWNGHGSAAHHYTSLRAAPGTRYLGPASPYISLRKRHQPRRARENLVEHHADDADHQDCGDHVGDGEVVPFVPDEVADAGAADEHLGRDDDQPRDADGNSHPGENRRRGRWQDDGEGAAEDTDLECARDVEPFPAYGSDAKCRVDQHRPQRADEDHEDRGQARILDGVERKRHPGERRDRLEHLDERVERPAHQRRHADEKADRNRHRHGDEVADHHSRDRVRELNAEPLVIGAAVVERVFEMLPNLQADIRWTRHRRFALARGRADELRVFRVHVG